MTTLGHERGGAGDDAHLGFEREFWELVETARKHGKNTDPLVRQQLAWAYTSVAAHALQRTAHAGPGRCRDGRRARRRRSPSCSGASTTSASARSRSASRAPTRCCGRTAPGYPTGRWQNVFLSSRAGTIYSGHQRDPAQHHRRARARAAQGAAAAGLTASASTGRVSRPSTNGRSIRPCHTSRVASQAPSRLTGPSVPGIWCASWSRRRGCASSSRRAASPSSARPTHSGWARFVMASERGDGLHRAADPRPSSPSQRVRPARPRASLRDLAEPVRPGVHPGADRRGGERARRRGRGGRARRGRARLRLPRDRPGRAGRWRSGWSPGPPRTGSPCSARTAWASSTRTPARAVRADRPAAAAGRPGGDRAAERRPGQRGADLRPVARDRRQHARPRWATRP